MPLTALIARLIGGDDEQAELAAAELATHGETTLPALQPLLASEDADSRWWATRVLGELTGPASTALLVERLSDSDESVRAAAILGLGLHADPAAAQPLAALLADPSGYIARQAGDALTRLGDDAIEALLDALQHDNPQVRAVAARALAHMPQSQAIPALFNALEDDSALVSYWADIGLERRGVGQIYFKP